MFTERYQKHIESKYSRVRGLDGLSSQIPFLVCDKIINLPPSVLERVQAAVRNIYEYAHSPARISKLSEQLSERDQSILSNAKIKNSSVLMAYDFHYELESDLLSLIEINTNGSAYLLSEALYQIDSEHSKIWPNAIDKLRASFERELQLMSFSAHSPHVAILDEAPEQQKMYVEFLMYDELFKLWGWSANIYDSNQFAFELNKSKFDLIYNRFTDFRLSQDGSKSLFDSYMNGTAIFTPHPREYILLADKVNLIEFAKNNVSEALIPTFHLKNHPDHAQVWANRKKYIFKPSSLYGSKGVYRGSSISNKMFGEIITQDFLVQEYRPPAHFGEWKYDLRFYVYQNEIHLGVARVYQGQVTNFKNLGGGLARLVFS